MKKYVLAAICFLFLSSNVYALDLSRVKTWATSEVLTAADLNGEFNNILNHSLTNNDIDAAAGIVGSKLDLSSPGVIGATTPAASTYTTLTINSTSIFKDKMSFTQTDNNEYIDSLADGYLDFEATTGLRFRINTAEQINLIDGVLAPTTDNDIDLGASLKEFKDLYITGTANIDSLVADTADINGGTLDGVQIGGTTATGELLVNDASDDADGLGSQGTSGQFLISQGAGANPIFSSSIPIFSTTTFSATALSGNISITAGKRYMVFLKITSSSADQTVYIQFDDDTTGTDYNWVNDEITMATSPASSLSGDNSDSFISLGINNSGEGMVCTLFLDTNVFVQTAGNDIGIHGQCVGNANDGTGIIRTVAGGYADAGTLTTMEFYANTGNMTGNVILYEM